jgi:hypothetical protein
MVVVLLPFAIAAIIAVNPGVRRTFYEIEDLFEFLRSDECFDLRELFLSRKFFDIFEARYAMQLEVELRYFKKTRRKPELLNVMERIKNRYKESDQKVIIKDRDGKKFYSYNVFLSIVDLRHESIIRIGLM